MKRAAVGVMAAIMVAGTVCSSLSVPMNVKAGSIVEDSEQATQTEGSLTIHKKNASEKYTEEEAAALQGVNAGDLKPLKDVEFTMYKFMDLTPGATAGEYAQYTKVAAYAQALKDINPDSLGNYSASDIEGLVEELLAAAENDANKIVLAKTGEDGITKAEDLSLGYYLVVETDAPTGTVMGKPFIVAIPSTSNYNDGSANGTSWIFDIEVEPKNATTVLDKNISNANGDHENGTTAANKDDEDTVALNDYVDYIVETTIPDYAASYFEAAHKPVFIIKDTMSDGLRIYDTDNDAAYKPVVVKVGETVLTEGTHYTITTLANNTGDTPDLVIEFTQACLENDEFKGKGVVVTYSALVTEDAVIGTVGNPNKVIAEYTSNPGDETNAELPEVDTKVYTYKLKLRKVEEDSQLPLADAKFELYKAGADGAITDEKVGEGTSDGNGILSFDRIDSGVYYLKETQSPDGYTLLTNPIKIQIVAKKDANGNYTGEVARFYVNDTQVTATTEKDGTEYQSYIDATGGMVTVAVENKKGFNLPETGGMGVTIFLAIGLAGIAGVSVMMMRKKKEQ